MERCEATSVYPELDVVSDYWDFVQGWLRFLESHSGTPGFGITAVGIYGYDNRRTEYHDRLCDVLGISKDRTKQITDNIDSFDCFESFYDALLQLKGQVNTEEKL